MTIQILGTYPSGKEAITAVDVHKLAGLREENITLFTNEEQAKLLDNQTNVSIKTDTPPENDGDQQAGFIDKMKGLFSQDDDYELDSKEKLIDFGLTELEAAQCLKDVKNGEIVVLADDELRMGHDKQMINSGKLQ